MKFSLVFPALFVVLPSCTRPEGVDVVEHEIHAGNDTDLGQDRNCLRPKVLFQTLRRCKLPHQNIYDRIRCQMCGHTGNFWRPFKDEYYNCKIECCDQHRHTPHSMCECTPYRAPYKFVSKHRGIPDHGANSPEKCCGRDKHNRPTLWHRNHDACGCTDVYATNFYGGQAHDCCSGKSDAHNKCLPGDCAKKGTSGKCCRVATDKEKRKASPSCPCFHAGEAPNPNDDVDYSNCCAGWANAAQNACGCISNGTTDLPEGALAKDCCSNQIAPDGKHCVAAKCSEVGTKIVKGQHCCSNEQDAAGTCTCIRSGKVLPEDGTALDCCSGRVDGDKKCAFLKAGEPVPAKAKGSICLSGSIYFAAKANEGYCRCLRAGQPSTNATQCCSGAVKGGKCTCVGVGEALATGGKADSCCSGLASPRGICRCGPPGSPIPGPDNNVTACCAGKAGVGGKFCGCIDQKAESVSEALGDHCCGGAFSYSDGKCNCLKKGHHVGMWVAQDACCNGLADSECK